MTAPIIRTAFRGRLVGGCNSFTRLTQSYVASPCSSASPSSSSSSSSPNSFCREASTSAPRQAQHERTQTPARDHRSSLPRKDVNSQSGEPMNSSTKYSQQAAQDNAERASDLASGLQSPDAQMGPRGGEAVGMPGASGSKVKETMMAGLSPQAGSPSSLASTAPEAMFPAGPTLGYTPSALPTRTDDLLEAFVNQLQRSGKKSQAARQISGMLHHLSVALNSDPLPALREAVNIASPITDISTLKVRAKVHHIPFALNARQQRSKAIRHILQASSKRPDREIERRLAREIISILEGNSETIKKKESMHKEAVRNRANILTLY